MQIILRKGIWKELIDSPAMIQNKGKYEILVTIATSKPADTATDGVRLNPTNSMQFTPEAGEKVYAICNDANNIEIEIFDPVPMVGYDGTAFQVVKVTADGKLEVSGTFVAGDTEQSDPTKLNMTEANSGDIKNAVEAIQSKQIDGSQKAQVEQADPSKLKNTELNSGDIKTLLGAVQTLLTAIRDTSGIKKITDDVEVVQPNSADLKNTEVNSGSIKTAVEAIQTGQTDGSQKSQVEQSDASKLKNTELNSGDIKALLTAIKETDGIKKIVDAITEANSADIKTAVEAIQTGQKDGEQKSQIVDEATGKSANVSMLGGLNTYEVERLAGTSFSGTTKDPNFWTEDNDGSGSISQSGEVTLSTGVTADSRARYTSIRKARKITGVANLFKALARNVQTPSANTVRRIGAFDSQEGFFFQFNGTVFGIGVRKGGSDTIVNNGSFNGNLGSTVDLGGATDMTKVAIEYTSLSAKFFINGELLHTVTATTASLTNSLSLKVQMEIYNENGNTTNNQYEILFASIICNGKRKTSKTYKYIGTNSVNVLKYGAGRIASILVVDNDGTTNVYDGTTTGGTLIAEINSDKVLGALPLDVTFNEGLTIETTGNAKVTVIYE